MQPCLDRLHVTCRGFLILPVSLVKQQRHVEAIQVLLGPDDLAAWRALDLLVTGRCQCHDVSLELLAIMRPLARPD